MSEFDRLQVMDEDRKVQRFLTWMPVVNGDKLVGIVARRDIVFGYVKALARSWPSKRR